MNPPVIASPRIPSPANHAAPRPRQAAAWRERRRGRASAHLAIIAGVAGLYFVAGRVGLALSFVHPYAPADVGGVFAAVILSRLAPDGRSLVYSNAGHWPGYVLDGHGDAKAVLASTDTPLGLYPDGSFPAAAPVTLAPGDLIFLPTDGVIESFSADGVRFGAPRALDVIRAHRARPPAEIVEALFQAVAAHSGGVQRDDVTAIVLKVEAPV